VKKDKRRAAEDKRQNPHALVPIEREMEEPITALRADIKAMVHSARDAFHGDVLKVLEETRIHAAELERAIGDISQIEALEGLKSFVVEELDRVLAKYA
jgi:hypothetical protein